MRDKVVRHLEDDFDVVGSVEDGGAVLTMAPQMLPDVCVLDISMPILSGIETAQKLRAGGSTSRIVLLTVHDDRDFLEAALEAGALGYVLKSRMGCDLVLAINAVMAGRLFISPSSNLST
jgi:DNA-binding NarL/FixJ family response regulator